MSDSIKTIGVLTSGGDSPGMNAVVRAVVRRGLSKGLNVKGIRRGYLGLIGEEIVDMEARSVSNVMQHGGTILETERCPEFELSEIQDKAIEICKKNGYERAELLDDGSLRITMSPEQYDQMLGELRTNIDKGISEILGSGNYPAVTKIEYNEDYSVFTVTVNDEIGIVERQLAEELIMYGTYYHVCSANDVTSIRVDYADQETGEVLESADSGNLETAY